MSSILKALRKLEEEKAARREGGLDIGRDILCGTAGRRRGTPWLLPASILAGVLFLGWGGYVLLAPPGIVPVPPVPGTPPNTAPLPSSEPVVGEPATVAAPARSLSLLPRTVIAEPPVVEETIDSREPAAIPTARTRQTVAKPAAASPVASAPVAQRLPTQQREPAALAVAPATVPGFQLSAIAYNEDAEARLAVINDLPVMIGTSIDEAIVEDILSDRVRLRQNGKSFEIPLPK